MTYLNLLPSCIITEGYRRSLLYDWQSNKSRLLSREAAVALKLFSGRQAQEFEEYMQSLGMTSEAIANLLTALIDEGFVYLSSAYIAFEPMQTEFDQPFLITNVLIDVANTNIHLLPRINECFRSIICPHIQFRVFKDVTINESLLNAIASIALADGLNTIEVFMPFYSDYEKLVDRLGNNGLLQLVLYNAPKDDSTPFKNASTVVQITESLDFPTCCGVVDMSYFNFSIEHYTEAIRFNSCLNRKMSIDQFGLIKNCPSMKNDFGSVVDFNFSDVLKVGNFFEVGGISKDQVKVCKDCEFRHVCTDCRAYLNIPNDIYSKPLKCGYDPYTCTWNEWKSDQRKFESMRYYNLEVMDT